MAVAATCFIVAGAPLAQAVPVPTNPSASPDTIYPYVDSGRADTSVISFSSVEDTHLVVFDDWNSVVFTRNAGTEVVTWSGEATGGGLVPADGNGTTYQACIFQDGEDDSIPVEGYCDTVTVVHVDRYFYVDHTKLGREVSVVKTVGNCRITQQRRPLLVKCQRNGAAILRYRFRSPGVSSEQELTGSTYSTVVSDDFRHGLHHQVRPHAVRVVTDDNYWGKVRRVTKSFEVHEEY
jgi:hypothetical protein